MAETKSVYKNKKNDPTKKKTTSKRQLKRITKTCIYCGKTQSETMFYKSNNPLHEDGFLPICKDCIKENSYDEDIDAVDMEKLKADMKSDKVKNTLKSVSDLANKIQVTGVPTLVLNNKILQTLDVKVIQEAIDAAK